MKMFLLILGNLLEDSEKAYTYAFTKKTSYTSVNALSILKHTHTHTHIIRLGNCHLKVLMVHNSHSSKYTVPIQAMGGRYAFRFISLKLTLHTKNTSHSQCIRASSLIAISVLLFLWLPFYFIDSTFRSSSLFEGKMTSHR